jgi:superkiller protein 3
VEPAPAAAAPPASGPPQLEVEGRKISPETAAAIEAGNAAITAKDWPAARENYVKAAAELPDNASLLNRIAVAYLGEGNKAEALRYARLASEKAPQDAGPWQLIAELEIEKGNADEGLAALAKIPPEKIVDSTLYLNAGIALFNKKRLPEAEAAFDKAIAVKPDASAYYYRGLARYQEKKMAEAKADLRKALELAPDSPDAKDIQDLLKSIP